MAQLLAKMRGCPTKLSEKKGRRIQNSDPMWPLYSKISDFVSQDLLKPKDRSESMSLKGLIRCFDLIDLTNKAFSKLVIELDYPVHEWGGKATEEYLSYTMNLLTLLNLVHSSVSQLNQAKISMLRALTEPSLKKIPVINLGKELKIEQVLSGAATNIKPAGPEKERVILQALSLVKGIGYLALGFILAGLCSNERPYDEIRRFVMGFKDSTPPLVKDVDSRFREAIVQNHGICEEVRDVNRFGAKLSDEAVMKVRIKLELLGGLIQGIEKQGSELFSQVLAARSKLLDGFR